MHVDVDHAWQNEHASRINFVRRAGELRTNRGDPPVFDCNVSGRRSAGQDDDAMVHLKRAVAIFTEVGADEATRLPEIWKLVSW